MSTPQPMNREDLETARVRLAKGTSLTLGLGTELLEAHDYYRARCPVFASDVGPEHTAVRMLAYALANGWTESLTGTTAWYARMGEGLAVRILTHASVSAAAASSDCVRFCGTHAQASGMAPLDVLAAIGSMP